MRTMLTLLAAGLLLAWPALAEDLDDVPSISVVGTAITEVEPDEMVWSLQVRNQGPELRGVAAAHHELMARVLAMLRDAGIAEEETRTDRMRFGENRVYRGGTQYTEGYFAATSVTFTSGDLDRYAELWMQLADFEGLAVQNVAWQLADPIPVQDETRKEALRAAARKARELAAVLDAEVGEPLHVAEQDAGLPVHRLARNAMMMDESAAPAGGPAHAPGRITIRMTMAATFRLIPGE